MRYEVLKCGRDWCVRDMETMTDVSLHRTRRAALSTAGQMNDQRKSN
jgi:hypothetical protein